MPDKFLSQDEIDRLPKHSHKRSRLWQYLHYGCDPGQGALGDLIRKLRVRRDMAPSYQNITALRNYLHSCKIPSTVVETEGPRLYEDYRQYVERLKHPRDDTAVMFLDPKQLVKSGVKRYDIALTVLRGWGLSNPAENLKLGGSLADRAYHTADLIIDLINTRADRQRGQRPKSAEELLDEREAVEGFKMKRSG